MNDNWIIAANLIGVILIIIYIIKFKFKNSSLGDAVIILLSSNGLFVGLKLCYLIFAEKNFLPASFQDSYTYIFIGGLAVIWVSIESIINKFTIVDSKK